MRAEDGTVIVDLHQVVEAENLESSAVGQNGAVPAHEPVEAAEAFDPFGAGPQRQVVSVGEQHLGAQVVNLLWRERFDGRLGADGHECRRLDQAVGGAQAPAPCTPLLRQQLEHYSLLRERGRAAWGFSISMQSPKL